MNIIEYKIKINHMRINITDKRQLINKYKGFFADTCRDLAEKKQKGVNYSRDETTGLYIPTENIDEFMKELTRGRL